MQTLLVRGSLLLVLLLLLGAVPTTAQETLPLPFATYLGGSQFDGINGVTTDADGRLIVVGTTISTDFPTQNAAQPELGGAFDAFITIIDPETGGLGFSTYLGGTRTDFFEDVRTDADGNIYLVGATQSETFPGAAGKTAQTGQDAVITKVAADGTVLFSNTIGGDDHEEGRGLTLADFNNDGALDFFITGITASTNFPLLNPVQDTHGGGIDAYVAIFDGTTGALLFSTYLGGSGDDTGNAIVTGDFNGDTRLDLAITGGTNSDDVATHGRQETRQTDPYVAYLLRDPSPSTIPFTLQVNLLPLDEANPDMLDGDDEALAMVLSLPDLGNPPLLYLTGQTASTAFPTTAEALQATPFPNDNTDAFFMAVSLSEAFHVEINYSTLLGGVGDELCRGIDADESFINLSCSSSSFLVLEGFPQIDSGNLFQLSVTNDFDFVHLWRVGRTPDVQAQKASGSYIGGWSRFGPAITNADVTFQPEENGGGDGLVACFPSSTQDPSGVATDDNFRGAGSTDDPVSTFTGELFLYEPLDLALGGPLPLHFGRYYASLLDADGRVQSALGPNWVHTFGMRLIRTGDDHIEAVNNRGRVTPFERNGGAWTQTDKLDYPLQLVETESGFALGNPLSHLRYTFDTEGRPTAIADKNGNTLTLVYDGNNRLTTVADGLGRQLTLSYNAEGNLIAVSDDTGRTVGFGYTNGMLTHATTAEGETTTYSYTAASDRQALLVAATRPEGHASYTQDYDDQGRVSRQTDALGNPLTLTYAPPRTMVTNALGRSFEHVHSPDGRVTSFTDETGQTVHMGYDAEVRRNQITDRLGAITTFSYDTATALPRTVTEATGATTTFTYTARTSGPFTFMDLSTLGFPDGTSLFFSYDGLGNLTRLTDPAGGLWTYTYNERGQVRSVTNPNGGTTTYAYHADGTLASLQDPAGNTTTYAYDSRRRLAALTHADGTTRRFTYDAADRLLTLTDELGHPFSYSYDLNGNLTRVDDPVGTTLLAYDALDRLVHVSDRVGALTSFSYDALGRLTQVVDRNGTTRQLGYDVLGRVTAYTEGGASWTFSYDAEGVPTSFKNPEGESYAFTSNEMGWLTDLTTPLGHLTRFSYDIMGRVTAIRDAAGHSTTYSYDARGLPTAMTLPDGASAHYGRNPLGPLDQVTDPGSNTWSYDRDALGRLAATSDPLGRTTDRAYDARHRPVEHTFPGTVGTAALTFDAAGNLIRASYSDGTHLTYNYDALHRLVGATDLTLTRNDAGHITESNGLMLGRDAEGRLTSVRLPAGEVQYRYDARNLVTHVEDWMGGVTAFSYDGARQLTSITRPNGTVTRYTYDDAGRLVGQEETANDGATMLASATLERDERGYITRATRKVPLAPTLLRQTHAWDFDAAAQVTGNTYDDLGRITEDGTRTYTWEGTSRLTAYSEQGRTVQFTYDALGNRLSRSTDGMTRQYVWNYGLGLPSVSVEQDGTNEVRYYVHAPGGQLLYSVEGGEASRRYYHYDDQGNTLFLTDDNASVIAAYAYSPYGELLAETGDLDNVFTFQGATGVIQEGTTGLYYARARYYDSTRGRFLSRDPLRGVAADRINPYPYAGGNPTNYSDPTGRDRRSSLAGNLLIEDRRNVFFLPHEVANYVNFVWFDFLSEQPLDAQSLLNARGSAGGLLFGDTAAFPSSLVDPPDQEDFSLYEPLALDDVDLNELGDEALPNALNEVILGNAAQFSRDFVEGIGFTYRQRTNPVWGVPLREARRRPSKPEPINRGNDLTGVVTETFTPACLSVGLGGLGHTPRISLTNQPVISTIRVFFDEGEIPSTSPSGTVNWSYDFATNTVNFSPFARPGSGTSFRIAYTPVCP